VAVRRHTVGNKVDKELCLLIKSFQWLRRPQLVATIPLSSLSTRIFPEIIELMRLRYEEPTLYQPLAPNPPQLVGLASVRRWAVAEECRRERGARSARKRERCDPSGQRTRRHHTTRRPSSTNRGGKDPVSSGDEVLNSQIGHERKVTTVA
jgi:hypothetical protein